MGIKTCFLLEARRRWKNVLELNRWGTVSSVLVLLYFRKFFPPHILPKQKCYPPPPHGFEVSPHQKLPPPGPPTTKNCYDRTTLQKVLDRPIFKKSFTRNFQKNLGKLVKTYKILKNLTDILWNNNCKINWSCAI